MRTPEGGLFVRYSDPVVLSCHIVGNTAAGGGPRSGGGVHCWYANPTFVNCVIRDNAATWGAGLSCYASSPVLTNCTTGANVAGTNGGAMSLELSSAPALVNCVLWGDMPQEIYVFAGTPSVAYSDIQGGQNQPWFDGNTCIDVDPLFADADLRIASGSPCIDAGDTVAVPLDTYDQDGDEVTDELLPFDRDGHMRLVDDLSIPNTGSGYPPVDMGAYEFQGQ